MFFYLNILCPISVCILIFYVFCQLLTDIWAKAGWLKTSHVCFSLRKLLYRTYIQIHSGSFLFSRARMGGVRKHGRRSGKIREERKGEKECPSCGIVFGYHSTRERREGVTMLGSWNPLRRRCDSLTGPSTDSEHLTMWGWTEMLWRELDFWRKKNKTWKLADLNSWRFGNFFSSKGLLFWRWITNLTSKVLMEGLEVSQFFKSWITFIGSFFS